MSATATHSHLGQVSVFFRISFPSIQTPHPLQTHPSPCCYRSNPPLQDQGGCWLNFFFVQHHGTPLLILPAWRHRGHSPCLTLTRLVAGKTSQLFINRETDDYDDYDSAEPVCSPAIAGVQDCCDLHARVCEPVPLDQAPLGLLS